MRNLILALIKLFAGIVIGLLILEQILLSNPTLLVRGVAYFRPVDMPLTTLQYQVRYSDADVFTWRPELIKSIPDEDNQVEANVLYQTDEFGFHNQPPVRSKVDIVAVGRSVTQGAQVATPWTSALSTQTGWQVLNLAQPSAGLWIRREALTRFGFSRTPRWVIIEVIPNIDILSSDGPPRPLAAQMVVPVLQNLLKHVFGDTTVTRNVEPIYPLAISINGRPESLTCCLHYMDFYTLDQTSLKQSNGWIQYSTQLLDLVELIRQQHACPVLLIAPNKPEIYFPLVDSLSPLEASLKDVQPLHVDLNGDLASQPDRSVRAADIRKNVMVGHQLIASFADEHGIRTIDPAARFAQALQDGEKPFMQYDNHWNEFGHQLVAETAAEALADGYCP